MSIGLVVASMSSVPTALLQKAFRFRFLAAAQVAQSIVASTSTLLLALFGAGYWALALGPLLGQLTMSVTVVVGAPSGYQWPDWRALSPALRFSRAIILERFCWLLYSGSDRFLIGKWISEAAVGLYSVASSIGMMAVEKVATQVVRVAPAAFAEVQKDPALVRRYLLSMTEGLSIVGFPISIGITLVAGDLVRVLFGEQWTGAIVPLRILALFAAYQAVTMPVSRVFAATGDIRFLMHVGMLTLAILPLAFMVGTHWGLAGVAAVWVLVYPFTQLPLLVRLFGRIQLRWSQYLRALWPGVSASLLMGLALWLLRQWPPVAGLPITARLALRVGVGAIIYTLAILIFHAERVRLFKSVIDDFRAKNEPDTDSQDSSPTEDQRPSLIG
jgi:O-antigen/teichoic acid export membrane protein